MSISLLFLFSLAVSLEQPAYGYVDPGSGLLLTQIIGSVFTAAVFSLRRRVVSLFRSGEGDETERN